MNNKKDSNHNHHSDHNHNDVHDHVDHVHYGESFQPHEEHNHSDHEDHSHHGHGGHNHSHHADLFKKKFFASLFLGVPILFISPMMGITLPFQFTFPYSEWLVLILSTILFIYGGEPFLSGAKDEIKDKNPGMMTLISLGITVAYFYSLYAFVMNNFFPASGHYMDFFWELASLIIIMLLGHWIEMKAVGNAGNALEKMAQLLPNEVQKISEDGEIQTIPTSEVRVDDILLVKAGESIPADGIIVKGTTTVNDSLVTGESRDIEKGIDDEVIGGAINNDGTIQIRVNATGDNSYLNQVMALLGQAQAEKSKAETMASKVAKWLFYIAVIVGLLAFIIWLAITNDINIALERMVTVLIIACPHALGLAIPLVIARSTSIGAQNGLLIKDRSALEIAQTLDYVMVDKTGTLTEGNFSVNLLESLSEDFTVEEIIKYFAGLESNSSHPLAKAIVNEANEKNIQAYEATDIQTISGVGLEGTINGEHIMIVSASYLDREKIVYDKDQFRSLSQKGNSISYLLINKQVAGIVAQGDQIKEDAYELVNTLHQQGIKIAMLTGDNEGTASFIAEQLNIDQVHAQLLPEDKDKIIRDYQDKGQTVMMVGDGINDAPSLARADIGVAIGAGTDIAIDSADVVLVKSKPSDIVQFLSLAKQTTRKMVQNLWWGAGYNFIAIPLAAGIIANWGIILSPAVGAVIMSLSTVIVAMNAMTLKVDK